MKISKDVYLVGDGAIRLSSRYDCHIYLLDGGGETLLVDTGSGLEPELILRNIKEHGFEPKDITRVFVTHCHADHAGGCEAMKAETGCEVVAPELEARLMEGGSEQELGLDVTKAAGIYPPDYVYRHIRPDKRVKDGEVLKVGRYELKCIEVPGHNPGPACLLVTGEGRRALFSNDVVFMGGTIGLGNWPGSSLADYRKNIGKLAGLSVEELYPGHFLWTLRGGQEHLDRAISNLQQPFPPPNFSHNYPHF